MILANIKMPLNCRNCAAYNVVGHNCCFGALIENPDERAKGCPFMYMHAKEEEQDKEELKRREASRKEPIFLGITRSGKSWYIPELRDSFFSGTGKICITDPKSEFLDGFIDGSKKKGDRK